MCMECMFVLDFFNWGGGSMIHVHSGRWNTLTGTAWCCRYKPPKGGFNKNRLTLIPCRPETSPISEEDKPIAEIWFVQPNPIRAILDEKWQGENACWGRQEK